MGILKGYTHKELLDYASKMPKPMMMAGQLLDSAGAISIIFGESGSGKSTLAMQIADGIAKGTGLFDGMLPSELGPTGVLYVDAEMNEVQIAERTKHIKISELVRISPLNFDSKYSGSLGEAILTEIENTLYIFPEAFPIVVVDNITVVSDNQEDATAAKNLMYELKAMAGKYNVHLILIGHTPKIGEGQKLFMDNLAGSKNYTNLSDSVIAVGKTINPGYRYIKQVKRRLIGGEIYHSDNVIVTSLDDYGVIQFEGFDREVNLIKQDDDDARDKYREEARIKKEERNREILALSATKPSTGISNRDIARKVGCHHSTVASVILANMHKS